MPIQVHWLMQSLADVPQDDAWLSAAERRVLGELRFPKRRAEWRLGRWTAKRALMRYQAAASELVQIEVVAAADGAPEAFLRGEPLPVALSLSHRERVALCAVAPADAHLGCDLELVEPRSARFVDDYFTPAEVSRVRAAPQAHHPVLANLIWSAKESALKALREGLRRDTRTVEVTVDFVSESASVWCALAVDDQARGERLHGWWRTAADDLLLTVVASPAPAVPQPLPETMQV